MNKMNEESVMTSKHLYFRYVFGFSFAFLLMLSAQNAFAQGKLEVEGDVSFVTDYIHRGLSRSDGGVALQANVYVYSDNGFSAGIFASTLDKDFLGHDGELEVYADYGGSFGAYDYNFSAGFNTFHGSGNSSGYGNFKASISRDFGRVYIKAGSSFSPSNREIGEGSSFYSYLDAEVPIPIKSGPSLSLGVKAGYEDFEGPLDKWDWRVGLYMGLLDYEVGLQYSGSNQNNMIGSGERALLALRRYF